MIVTGRVGTERVPIADRLETSHETHRTHGRAPLTPLEGLRRGSADRSFLAST